MTARPLQTDPSPKVLKVFEIEFNQLDAKLAPGIRTELLKDGYPPNVEIPVEVFGADCESCVRALPKMLAGAREAVAKAMLDPKKFKTASALVEATRSLVKQLEPIAAYYAGDPVRQRFVAEAVYSGDGGPFGDSTEAADAAEAEFLVRWTMAENAGYSIERSGDQGFADAMARQNVHTVQAEPIAEHEFRQMLFDLTREALAAGHCGPALDVALEAAKTLGETVAPPASPPGPWR